MNLCRILHLLFAIYFIVCSGDDQGSISPRGWRAAEAETSLKNIPSQTDACSQPVVISTKPPLPDATTDNKPLGIYPDAHIVAAFLLGLSIGWVLSKRSGSNLKATQLDTQAPKTLAVTDDNNDKEKEPEATSSSDAIQTPIIKEVAAAPATVSALQQIQSTTIIHGVNTLPPSPTTTNDIITQNTTSVAAVEETSITTAPPTHIQLPQQQSIHPHLDPDTQAAGQLVTALMTAAGIDVQALSTEHRLQATAMMVQVRQGEQDRRFKEAMQGLGSEANSIRSRHADIVQTQVEHIISQDTHALAQQLTHKFRSTCSDILLTGIVLMLIVASRQAYLGGAFQPFYNRCGSLPRLSNRYSKLWAMYRAAEVIVCYISAAANATVGAVILLIAPYLLYRSGFLADYHTTPVFKLLAGLGVACGAAGYVALERMGVAAGSWLCFWELWVVVHVVLSTTAEKIILRSITSGKGMKAGNSVGAVYKKGVYEGVSGWLVLLMWVVVGVGMPVLTALMPFTSLFRDFGYYEYDV